MERRKHTNLIITDLRNEMRARQLVFHHKLMHHRPSSDLFITLPLSWCSSKSRLYKPFVKHLWLAMLHDFHSFSPAVQVKAPIHLDFSHYRHWTCRFVSQRSAFDVFKSLVLLDQKSKTQRYRAVLDLSVISHDLDKCINLSWHSIQTWASKFNLDLGNISSYHISYHQQRYLIYNCIKEKKSKSWEAGINEYLCSSKQWMYHNNCCWVSISRSTYQLRL